MTRVGLSPLGVEPCSMNRSRLVAYTVGSLLLSVSSIGLRAGTVPSSEPGLLIPHVPLSPWHFLQLFTKTSAPALASPVSLIAGPGPPGFDGRATAAALAGGAVGAVVAVRAEAVTGAVGGSAQAASAAGGEGAENTHAA